MDLKQLEYFVRVAELGSFTRAAQALSVAQPALSRQVRLLEVELRQNLLVRNGRGASTTEAGKLMLEHARGILHQVARAHEELGRVRGSLAGRVAVGMPPSVARVLTVPLTRAFRQRMPQAQLSVSEGLTATLQQGLQSGRLDIAVLYNADAAAELDIRPLVMEELVVVRQRGADALAAELSLADLAALPLVVPSRPNAIRMWLEQSVARAGLRLRVALEIDGVSAILDLVADGAGCAVLPRHAVLHSAAPAQFVLQPLQAPGLHIPLSVAVSAQRPATLTQRAMLELLQEVALAKLSD